jgi:uncharacterized membrane protein YqiK
MPHAAAVQRDARIAQAEANRLATEAEQKAAARMSEATRDSEILQAGYQAERDKAAAKARQAGPLADAAARQDVVVQETRIAELDALRREQQLQADVRKPADAQAYETRARAEAERDARISAAEAKAKETELAAAAEANRVKTAANAEAEATKARGAAAATATRATGEAEAAAAQAKGLAAAEATRAQGLAEAETIKARAAALAENQEAVVAQQLAENWPEIVQAGASAFGNVDHMVLLNGAHHGRHGPRPRPSAALVDEPGRDGRQRYGEQRRRRAQRGRTAAHGEGAGGGGRQAVTPKENAGD